MRATGGEGLKHRVVIDPDCIETEIVIRTAQMTPEVQNVVELLQMPPVRVLQGYLDDEICFLPQAEILRVYSQQQKVYAQTRQRVYQLRMRLYEAEEMLEAATFLRISNAEIVNSRRIQKLDVSLSGTIGVYLEGGVKTFASRRYVPRIKDFFHIGKR